MQEHDLLEKLKKIERLYAGATTHGEKVAAADALQRIRQRLHKVAASDRPIEYKFTLADVWSKKLFIALLRRYDLKPYRHARQRRTTVMVRAPKSFIEDTLWPEFLDLSQVLQQYLESITRRVIASAIHADASDEEVIEGDYLG